jgi:hypothetical protein
MARTTRYGAIESVIGSKGSVTRITLSRFCAGYHSHLGSLYLLSTACEAPKVPADAKFSSSKKPRSQELRVLPTASIR